MVTLRLLFAALAVWSSKTSAQATDYKANAEAAFNALQEWYNTTSGLWNTCGWWNGANCMTAIADLATVDSSIDPTNIFSTTYAQAPAYNPSGAVVKQSGRDFVQTLYGQPPAQQHLSSSSDSSAWLDSCYDDNGWWALAWIAAYDLTSNADYLSTAEGIFSNLTAAWPSSCNNGGIPWCTTSTYINAIANELFLSVAAHLANRASDSSSKATYVSWAQQEWNWFLSVKLINSQGVIVDGLGSNCLGDPADTVWSYNQGVVLGGLVELSKADAGNASSYLDAANSIAVAAIANLTDSNGVLHDPCESSDSCAPDGTQFKGIFMRNLLRLHQTTPKDQYKSFFETNAQSIWNNDRNSDNQLSVDWAGPFDNPANASTQSSALDALVAALVVG